MPKSPHHPPRPQKYHAHKVIDPDTGATFDSGREYNRWIQLLQMQAQGKIHDLQRQVRYELIPTQREPDTIGPRGGIRKGRVIEQACSYIADFVYTDISTGETIVEDTKGMRTADYIIKRKLMLYIKNIKIREV